MHKEQSPENNRRDIGKIKFNADILPVIYETFKDYNTPGDICRRCKAWYQLSLEYNQEVGPKIKASDYFNLSIFMKTDISSEKKLYLNKVLNLILLRVKDTHLYESLERRLEN